MRTSLEGIANRATFNSHYKFGNLYGCLNELFLLDCFRFLKRNKAPGIDDVDLEDYEKDLEKNIKDLVQRLKAKRYRPPHVKRVYIPKSKNQKRPLGLPTVEDKLVQIAAFRLLTSIYEADFLDFSYGYRPKRSIHQAIESLNRQLRFDGYEWVVEVDIRSYFDTIDHDWLIRMLEERVKDKAFIRLIRKWLKAGVIEPNGSLTLPKKGTPQGGVISPILANIYLHYALDLWFEKVVKCYIIGKATIIRYADDIIVAFQYKKDAERFLKTLPKRLGKFNLEMAEEKTRIIEFGLKSRHLKTKFDFLGFEFRWAVSRKGKPWIKMQTSLKRFNRSLDNFKQWIKANRHNSMIWIRDELIDKCRSYRRHYQVPGNARRIQAFFWKLLQLLFKWLNRRSHRISYNWAGFNDLLRGLYAPLMSIMGLKPAKARA